MPIKSKTPRTWRGGHPLWVGRLPLADLLLAVTEDHIVQIAQDPVVHHTLITLLSSFIYAYSICWFCQLCKRKFIHNVQFIFVNF